MANRTSKLVNKKIIQETTIPYDYAYTVEFENGDFFEIDKETYAKLVEGNNYTYQVYELGDENKQAKLSSNEELYMIGGTAAMVGVAWGIMGLFLHFNKRKR